MRWTDQPESVLLYTYEGQQDTQTVTRLEAFMHQARAYQKGKKGGGTRKAGDE